MNPSEFIPEDLAAEIEGVLERLVDISDRAVTASGSYLARLAVMDRVAELYSGASGALIFTNLAVPVSAMQGDSPEMREKISALPAGEDQDRFFSGEGRLFSSANYSVPEGFSIDSFLLNVARAAGQMASAVSLQESESN